MAPFILNPQHYIGVSGQPHAPAVYHHGKRLRCLLVSWMDIRSHTTKTT